MKVCILILITLLELCNSSTFARTINVKKFGAKGDGKNNDTKSIQAAINSVTDAEPTIVYFPRGVYRLASITVTNNYLENYFLKVHSNLKFKGEGNRSILKIADHLFDKTDTSANAHLFYGAFINNISFENILIDMNGSKNLVPNGVIKNHCAIFMKHGSDVKIENTTIRNCAGRNMVIIIGTGKNLEIQKSKFINGGQYVGASKANPYQTDFSFIYTEWDSSHVAYNTILQEDIDKALNGFSGGIELHGSYSDASFNKIVGCNPGVYVSSSWHSMEKTEVTNNVIDSCLRGISFWLSFPMQNITLKNNSISITRSRALRHYILNGIETPNGNTLVYDSKHANGAVIKNLLIEHNTITSVQPNTTSDRIAGMVLHSLQNSVISNNKISGMNFGGVILQGSKWGIDSLWITGNNLIDFRDNPDTFSPAGYINITDHYSPKEKNAPGIKNVFIKNNTTDKHSPELRTRTGKGKKGLFFNVFLAGPSSMLDNIHLQENDFILKKEDVHFVKIN